MREVGKLTDNAEKKYESSTLYMIMTNAEPNSISVSLKLLFLSFILNLCLGRGRV